MKQIILFAGTTEGRELAEILGKSNIITAVCVATEYGETLVEKADSLMVIPGRMNAQEMEEYIKNEECHIIIDATHPYATEVSDNIRKACEKCDAQYIRLLRDNNSIPAQYKNKCIEVKDVHEAAVYLNNQKGNVLVTTGSKELEAFTAIEDYKDRVYARVLSIPEVVAHCKELGFEGRNLMCMQGPFSKELNLAIIKEYHIAYMVTKESGSAGGFMEKIEAANEAGIGTILIKRPSGEEGSSFEEVIEKLENIWHIKLAAASVHGDTGSMEHAAKDDNSDIRTVTLAGIGMGTYNGMTIEVKEACDRADVILGAKRMLQAVNLEHKPHLDSYKPEEMITFLKKNPKYHHSVILLSGDVGFYSGAKRLYEEIKKAGMTCQVLPGISSVVSLCAKLHTSWEDCKLISLHGRDANVIDAVKKNSKVFALLGGEMGICELAELLLEYGFSNVRLHYGQELGYPGEKIISETPIDLLTILKEMEQVPDTRSLGCVLIENDAPKKGIRFGLEDEAYLRGKAPMTKAEIRAVSLSKLMLSPDSICYDIGAGTGSVSVEMAMQAYEGRVYAIERKEEAFALLKENKMHFALTNLKPIQGLAPEALKELEAPTHVFIGGSAGNLREILELVLKKNPRVRIVVNAITLETVSIMNELLKILPFSKEQTQIVLISAARAKSIGGYEMMMGQNPVYIIQCEGDGTYE